MYFILIFLQVKNYYLRLYQIKLALKSINGDKENNQFSKVMKHLNLPFVRLDQTMAPTECSSRLEELLNAHEPGSLGQKLETKVFQQLVSEEMAFSS